MPIDPLSRRRRGAGRFFLLLGVIIQPRASDSEIRRVQQQSDTGEKKQRVGEQGAGALCMISSGGGKRRRRRLRSTQRLCLERASPGLSSSPSARFRRDVTTASMRNVPIVRECYRKKGERRGSGRREGKLCDFQKFVSFSFFFPHFSPPTLSSLLLRAPKGKSPSSLAGSPQTSPGTTSCERAPSARGWLQ